MVGIAVNKFDPAAFFAAVGGAKFTTRYSKNDRIFGQGDAAEAVFFIRRGQVKLAVVSAQGKDAVVALLNAGEFCGEGCLVGQDVQMATAVAMGNCELIRLKSSNFRAFSKKIRRFRSSSLRTCCYAVFGSRKT